MILVIKPQGGPDDWRSLFHEAGHTEHFAHTSASLSPEEKRLGDNAVTEGWAMLLEHLTFDPVWLERRLDFPRPYEFAAEGAASLLWYVRRYCAKLIYELEFHAAPDVTAMRPRYVELLSDALKVTPSDTDYLADIDEGFYSSQYLRAWAFEAQLALVPAREVRQRVVHAPRRGLAAARAVGARARSTRPTSCCATSRARRSSWTRSPTASAKRSRPPERNGGPEAAVCAGTRVLSRYFVSALPSIVFAISILRGFGCSGLRTCTCSTPCS